MTGRLVQLIGRPRALPVDPPVIRHGDRPPPLKVVLHDVEVKPREAELPTRCPSCGLPLDTTDDLYLGLSELRDESQVEATLRTRFLPLVHVVECMVCRTELARATFSLPLEEP